MPSGHNGEAVSDPQVGRETNAGYDLASLVQRTQEGRACPDGHLREAQNDPQMGRETGRWHGSAFCDD